MDKKTAYHAYYYSNVDDVTAAQLRSLKSVPDVDVSAVQARMAEKGIQAVVEWEMDYPWRMQTAPAAPYVLYYQWSLELLNRPTIAIVGPREMSPYAQEVLEQLFAELQHMDVVTVSGMAPWVDTLCHELSLRYHIPTIAILGGGFKTFLHSPKRELMERIVTWGGLILSEYKHTFKPTTRSFPQRNRLIAAVADVIFLPEAKENSWSLITADIGYKLHKPVAAPPGSIFATSSKGTNTYIAVGRITPISDLKIFVEKYYTRHTDKKIEKKVEDENLSDAEKKIVSLLHQCGEISFSGLQEKTWYELSVLLGYISLLEINGIIAQYSPGFYGLIKNNK